MSKKRICLSDQVRVAVDASGKMRSLICKEAVPPIDPAVMCRFMAGANISLATLDALADVLKLNIVAGSSVPTSRKAGKK